MIHVTGIGPPRTFWLHIRMPWKHTVYDINVDGLVRRWASYAVGFRFWRF